MIRNFGPVFVGRGVVQISAYVDTVLASLLPDRRGGGALLCAGAVHPAGEPLRDVGLGGGAAGDVERDRQRERACGATCGPGSTRAATDRLLRGAVGDGVSRPGRRRRRGAVSVGRVHPGDDRCTSGAILAGSAVGLLASTLGRLYASTFYALHDTRTPLRYRHGPRGPDDRCWAISSPCRCRARWVSSREWGAAGLTASRRDRAGGSSSSCSGARSTRRIGADRPAGRAGRPQALGSCRARPRAAWVAAARGAAGPGIRWSWPSLVLGVFGLVYFVSA